MEQEIETQLKQLDDLYFKQLDLLKAKEIEEECKDILDIFNQINELVHKDDQLIDLIKINTEHTKMSVAKANDELIDAYKYSKSYRTSLIAIVLGASIGGPVGLALGIKTIAGIRLSSITGSVFGFLCNKIW